MSLSKPQLFAAAGFMPRHPDPLLSLRHVSHQFQGQLALRGINLAVYPGDRLALVGPSGAGKSTLLRILNGSLYPNPGSEHLPQSKPQFAEPDPEPHSATAPEPQPASHPETGPAEVSLLGRDLTRLSQRQRRKLQQQIGTIYQQFNLVNSLRVIHNVNAGNLGRWSLAKALLSLAIPQEVAAARAILTQVGIPEKIFERTDQLSGGQQQRVAIARVLTQNPQIILADEPIASLDPERSREIMALLTQLCAGQGRALVVSLHDLDMAREWCDRIIGLRQGRICFDCFTAELTDEQITDLYSTDGNVGDG